PVAARPELGRGRRAARRRRQGRASDPDRRRARRRRLGDRRRHVVAHAPSGEGESGSVCGLFRLRESNLLHVSPVVPGPDLPNLSRPTPCAELLPLTPFPDVRSSSVDTPVVVSSPASGLPPHPPPAIRQLCVAELPGAAAVGRPFILNPTTKKAAKPELQLAHLPLLLRRMTATHERKVSASFGRIKKGVKVSTKFSRSIEEAKKWIGLYSL
ncbi:hypothetical protein THAOC_06383, partial [Thalassiosira oceanica]